MADDADFAQERIDAERENSVLRIQQELQNAPINTTGVCEDCDNPIGEERLRVMPTAQRCIICQGHYERGVW